MLMTLKSSLISVSIILKCSSSSSTFCVPQNMSKETLKTAFKRALRTALNTKEETSKRHLMTISSMLFLLSSVSWYHRYVQWALKRALNMWEKTSKRDVLTISSKLFLLPQHFLGWRIPNSITGLSGWWGPDESLGTPETVPGRCRLLMADPFSMTQPCQKSPQKNSKYAKGDLHKGAHKFFPPHVTPQKT